MITTFERRKRIAKWVAERVMPFEADVRRWLHRSRVSQEDVDELIQESYCLLARLDSVEHIARPDAYFFSVARNLLKRKLQRAKIVSFEAIAEIDSYVDESVFSPEREVSGRIDLDKLRVIMAQLPDRCRRVIELRKLEGMSQRDIARTLGISESIVENDVHLGVKQIVAAWRKDDAMALARMAAFEAGGRP